MLKKEPKKLTEEEILEILKAYYKPRNQLSGAGKGLLGGRNTKVTACPEEGPGFSLGKGGGKGRNR